MTSPNDSNQPNDLPRWVEALQDHLLITVQDAEVTGLVPLVNECL